MKSHLNTGSAALIVMLVVARFCFSLENARADSAAPTLLSPVNGMEITDVATYFQWRPVQGCTNFEVQIASDAGFTTIFKQKRTQNKGYHKNLYFPKDPLPAGHYF